MNAGIIVADFSVLSSSQKIDSSLTLNWSALIGFYGIGHSLRFPFAPKTSLITEEVIGWNTSSFTLKATGQNNMDTSFNGFAYRLAVGVEQQVGPIALQAKVKWTGGKADSSIADNNRLSFNIGVLMGFN